MILLKIIFIFFISCVLFVSIFDIFYTLYTQGGNYQYLITDTMMTLIKNSLLLSSTVTITSTILGILLTIFFISIKTMVKQKVTLGIFFIFFALQPTIYLATVNKNQLFNLFSPFWQSSIILSINMSFFSALIFVYSLLWFKPESFKIALLTSSKKALFRYILAPKILPILPIASISIFIFTFLNSEIPSFLGYRTYAEDFLAQVTLMIELETIPLLAIPFYILALFSSLFLFIWIKRYKTNFNTDYTRSFFHFPFFSNKIMKIISIFFIICILIFLTMLLAQIDYINIIDLFLKYYQTLLYSSLLCIGVSLVTLTLSIILYNFTTSYKIYILLNFIMLLSFFIPSSIFSFTMMKLISFSNFDSEIFEYIFYLLTLCLKFIPICYFLLLAFNKNSNKQIDISLNFLNISKFNSFTKITFAQNKIKWFLIIAILSIFILNELTITILLIPPGFEFIIIKIYNLMHYGDYATVTFLSILQISIIIALLLLFNKITGVVK